MREFKFRAWEKNLKEVIPVHNIDFEKRMINTESAWRFLDEIELMQYTGLKDKNGKEIYEGDIIKTPRSIFDNTIVRFRVKYIGASFALVDPKYHSNIYMDTLPYYADKTAVVIGNIYENPELLEES